MVAFTFSTLVIVPAKVRVGEKANRRTGKAHCKLKIEFIISNLLTKYWYFLTICAINARKARLTFAF